MSGVIGTNTVNDGLVEVVEPMYATGVATDVLRNKISTSTVIASNYTSAGTLLSNCDATGAGTSYVSISRNIALETGSITISLWFDLKGIPINVGTNNNWRTMLSGNNGTDAHPISLILEESNSINVSLTSGGVYRRCLNGNFTPYLASANGWQNFVFTYDAASGIAVCYKNSNIVLSGPMTTDTAGTNPSAAGSLLNYTAYQTAGFRIHGGSATSANPDGNGMVPGELGVTHLYNRALTAEEVKQNFEATRSRYGI